MAKYDVIHSCGHTREISLFGPHKERDRKLHYLATVPCFDCQKKAKEQKAIEHEKAEGLPTLTGTDKQIAWARAIRHEVFRQLSEIPAEKIDSEFADFCSWLHKQISAKWWIETRDVHVPSANPIALIAALYGGSHCSDWRSYFYKYRSRIKEAAEEDLAREKHEAYVKTFKTFCEVTGLEPTLDGGDFSKTVKKFVVWSNSLEKRIYVDGCLLYTTKNPEKLGFRVKHSEETLTFCKELTAKWKSAEWCSWKL